MATSALPRAITALLDALRTAGGLDGVDIIDGPPVDDIATTDFLAVGWTGSEDQAAESVQDFNGAGARTRDEDLTIACVIDVWSGDDVFATVRERAFEILGVVEMVIRATGSAPEAPTLNGAVLWAQLTRTQLRQYFTDQGARVALGFTVTCHARI
ncbi:hypothetical protein OZK63_21040 [Streptomyces sp. UMAF16]|uniref:hypothetical protein n=1 Tax=Streptomyces sp. SCL15-4 TaxID=2967221 RepID=UPI0022840A41|nr:hypothetical protein [Streptomyces sp. SCL15-4]MCZ0207901.1 hypothetical protein [Streptomyces sp. UMAF16]